MTRNQTRPFHRLRSIAKGDIQSNNMRDLQMEVFSHSTDSQIPKIGISCRFRRIVADVQSAITCQEDSLQIDRRNKTACLVDILLLASVDVCIAVVYSSPSCFSHSCTFTVSFLLCSHLLSCLFPATTATASTLRYTDIASLTLDVL